MGFCSWYAPGDFGVKEGRIQSFKNSFICALTILLFKRLITKFLPNEFLWKRLMENPSTIVCANGSRLLTALEARVISLILSQCTIDDKTLLKVVADETHVSKAMLVKIAKKLGFDGFRSLRAALALHNRLPLAKAHQELSDQPTARALAEKALGASLKALEEAFSLVSFESLQQAAQWLYAARQRDFYGLGGSAQVARDAACKFLRIGLRSSAFDDGLMMLMSASLLQKGDVAVAFSYSGQTLIVLEDVRQARKNGAHVIAITNSPGSRLTQVAHVVLCATV